MSSQLAHRSPLDAKDEGSAGARLARFAASCEIDDAARTHAVRAILDTLAVTIAGGAEPAVRTLAGTLDPAEGGGAVPSFWAAQGHRADDAALLFGMASHVLDYDDVSMLTVCHPSAPILSAVLCGAPWDEVSGADLVDAFAVGTEVLIRLGQAMGFRHYALGFHATATLGAVGAAAACARLMRLDPGRTGHALAITASLASGLRKNFGSPVKSLHVGIAASNGLKAARWAAAGLGGAPEPFEAEGFLGAFSGGETDRWPDGLRLGAPFALADPGFEQKRYPCCYMLHKMIEASLALRREGVRWEDVLDVRVDMPRGGTKPLIHPVPKSGMTALFSGPYSVVASLVDGRIDLKSFTDEAVLRPEIQARLADVALVETGPALATGGEVGGAPVTVTLRMRQGGALSRTVTASPGSPRDPLTPEQLGAKWADCLDRGGAALTPDQAARLFDEGLALARNPRPGEWLGALRTAVARA